MSIRRRIPCLILATVAGLAALASPVAAADVSLRGRVTDRSGKVWFEGAIVRIVELGVEVTSGRNGEFRLPPLPAGRYTLIVRYVGAPLETRQIQVRAGQRRLDDVRIGADVPRLANVLVVGQAAGQAAANSRKRAAMNVVDAVEADGIGQFPDQNLAEALGRLSGLSIVTEQGEGRFIVVRGVDPNLNAVSVAGARIPSGEDDARQTPLDLIPAELLESVEVAKTLTPDMDADAIGGAIEIKALSALDRDGFSASVRADDSFGPFLGDGNPKLSGSLTQRFDAGDDGALGIAVSASRLQRDFGWEAVETSGGWPEREGPDGSFRSLIESEQQDYESDFERRGLTFNVDAHAGDNLELYLRTLYTAVDDIQTISRNEYDFEAGEIAALDVDSGEVADGRLSKAVTDRPEFRRVRSYVAGGVLRARRWTFEYDGAWSEATEAEPGSIEGVFRGDVDLAYAGTGPLPILSPGDETGFQSSAYRLAEVVEEATDIRDRETHLRFDARRDGLFVDHSGYAKFGVKLRRRNKRADIDLTTYDEFGRDIDLSEFVTAIDYGLGPFGPAVDRGAFGAFVAGAVDGFGLDERGTLLDSRAEDYVIDEDVDAAYLMASTDFGRLRLLAGVRFERTRLRAQGTRVIDDAEQEDLLLEPVQARQRYSDVLPGAHFRVELTPRWLLRGALTRSLARPSFGDLAPAQRIEIETSEDGEEVRRAALGNPNLEPYRARNADLSLEYYGDDDLSVFAVAAFHKRIDDFVVLADVAGTGSFPGFEEALMPVNGERATLSGIELNYVRRFGFLPAPWDGLLAAANLTLADSDAHFDLAGRALPLPNQSDTVANLVLGYERGPASVRLAGNYRSERLQRLDAPEDPAFDVYEDAHWQLDLSLRWRFGAHWTIYADATNLTDRPLYEYYGSRAFHARYERYGRFYRFGLQYQF